MTLAEECQLNMGEPFTINMKMVRKRLAAIGRNKSIGPDGVPGEILKLGGEAEIPYFARLMDVTVNNATTPSDRKREIVAPVYKGGDGSVVTKYRPVNLTSEVCKQMEHVVTGYLMQMPVLRPTWIETWIVRRRPNSHSLPGHY